MEGAATMFNDCLLAVDEISECDPRDVGQIIYALGNGRGKQRASRTGSARGVSRWRCVILSSGERTIATAMAEGGLKAKAGQSVRILDLPVDRKFGLFDDLKGFASGSLLAESIKTSVQRHYGIVGRKYLEQLTHESREIAVLYERIKALPKFCHHVSGQEKRATNRFALVALAGELATEYGLTGWREGDALEAAAIALSLWCGQRRAGNSEQPDILGQLNDFLERHGGSRFEPIQSNPRLTVRDRAGWIATPEGETIWLTAVFRLKTLEQCGVLPRQKDGKHTSVERIGGSSHRVYPVKASQLAVCLNGA